MSLCLCHLLLGVVSRCLLHPSYTNWGQRMCRLSLDCCLPLCVGTLLPAVPRWHRRSFTFFFTQIQTRTPNTTLHSCSVSLFCQHQTHRESGRRHNYMGFGVDTYPDYGSISSQFHYLALTMAESDAFPSHCPNPLCFQWPFLRSRGLVSDKVIMTPNEPLFIPG